MSTFYVYSQETAVPRRMVRDMATEDRPLVRVKSAGVQKLSTAELLALVLQTPDALDLARDMLDRFGDLHALYQADTAVLESVHGVGAAKAAQVKAALELGRRSALPVEISKTRITSPADAANILWPEMSALTKEEVRVMILDTRNRIIAIKLIYLGSLNSAVVRISEVFRPAIINNGAAVIMAHNHPSQDPSPSPEDLRITREVAAVGKQLGIDLLDHLIIAASGFVSIKERYPW